MYQEGVQIVGAISSVAKGKLHAGAVVENGEGINGVAVDLIIGDDGVMLFQSILIHQIRHAQGNAK